MKSIRRQLTVRLSAALLAAVALAATSLFFAARHAALSEFDATLAARAELLESAIEEDDGNLELEFNLHRLPAWESPDHPTHYAVHSASGELLIASPHWTATGFPQPPPDSTSPSIADLQRADRNYRVLHTAFDAADDTDMAYQGLHLSIARDRSSLDAGLRRAAWLGAATALASLAILIPLLQRTLRSSLQPLEEFARRTDAIDPGKPPVTMETASLPAELSPIAAKLNELLARVHSSILRERRFARDVAHELRTPVAELRALAELASQWTDEATPEAFSQVLEITSEMEAMVASLTLLNRLEASASPITREPVNLSPILLRLIERSSTSAAAAGIRLSCPDLSSAITWETDATLWKAAASNLLGNAHQPQSPRLAHHHQSDTLQLHSPQSRSVPPPRGPFPYDSAVLAQGQSPFRLPALRPRSHHRRIRHLPPQSRIHPRPDRRRTTRRHHDRKQPPGRAQRTILITYGTVSPRLTSPRPSPSGWFR